MLKDSIGTFSSDGKKIPLKGIDIKADIFETASRVVISQRYKNTGTKPVEAVYCFPLESFSAVYDLEIIFKNKKIKAKIETKKEAQKIYDKATSKGDRSFLMEMERENIYNMSIGNLAPDEECVVVISYVAELTADENEIEFRIPLTVSPRYAPSDSDPTQVARITPPFALNVPYGLNLNIDLGSKDIIKSIVSDSHKIETAIESENISVKLHHSETEFNRDFILKIQYNEALKPKVMIYEADNNEQYAMLRLYPKKDLAKENTDGIDYIFLLDCSGSMDGTSIDSAKSVLELCLRSMSEKDKFSIVRFGSTYEYYKKKLVDYNQNNLDDAITMVKKIDADLGGTEIYKPLKFIYENILGSQFTEEESLFKGKSRSKQNYSDSDREAVIILITDGEVFNESEIIKYIKNSKKNFRIFSFGIGYGINDYFLKEIAIQTNGMFELISPDESIQKKVMKNIFRIRQNYIKNIIIDWDSDDVVTAYKNIPLIYADSNYTLYAKLKNFKKDGVVLTLEEDKNKIKMNAEVQFINDEYLISRLWAKKMINTLESDLYIGNDKTTKKIASKIIDLCKKYNIISDFTSFVGVCEMEDANKVKEKAEFLRIPIQLTRGWHGFHSDTHIPAVMRCCVSPAVNYSLDVSLSNSKFDHIEFEHCDSSVNVDSSPIDFILYNQNAEGIFKIPFKKLVDSFPDIKLTQKDLDSIYEKYKNTKSKISQKKFNNLLVSLVVMYYVEKLHKDLEDIYKLAFLKAKKLIKKHFGDDYDDIKNFLSNNIF